MKVLTLVDHAGTDEGHKMLAANQAADAADIGLIGDQVGAIAGTPNRPLDKSGDGLAMPPQNLARPLDEQQGVVDGVNAPPRIQFVAADDHVRVGLGGGVAEAFGVFAGNQQRLVVELNPNRNPLLQFGLPTFTPIGIASQPGFSESDEFGSVTRGLLNLLTGTVHALFPVQIDGGRLHHFFLNAAATTENFV